MSYLATRHFIGGHGGGTFTFENAGSGATLKKLWVWEGGWQIKAIKVLLTDGQSKQFGKPDGNLKEFTFEKGEQFTALSLWGNGAGTRLGGIKFKTNHSREFFAHMTKWGLKTEYPINVGSGICVGVTGRSGADIDCLAFMFIDTIKSTVVTNVNYPTLHRVIPSVVVEEIKSVTYHNNTTEMQEYKIESSKTIKTTSSWSVTSKFEFSYKCDMKTGIPGVMEVSAGYSFTLGKESTYASEASEERTELFSFPVKVRPGKSAEIHITIGRVIVDLPYTGTVQITCVDDSVLQFPVSGIYKGVTYTDAKVEVKE